MRRNGESGSIEGLANSDDGAFAAPVDEDGRRHDGGGGHHLHGRLHQRRLLHARHPGLKDTFQWKLKASSKDILEAVDVRPEVDGVAEAAVVGDADEEHVAPIGQDAAAGRVEVRLARRDHRVEHACQRQKDVVKWNLHKVVI